MQRPTSYINIGIMTVCGVDAIGELSPRTRFRQLGPGLDCRAFVFHRGYLEVYKGIVRGINHMIPYNIRPPIGPALLHKWVQYGSWPDVAHH